MAGPYTDINNYGEGFRGLAQSYATAIAMKRQADMMRMQQQNMLEQQQMDRERLGLEREKLGIDQRVSDATILNQNAGAARENALTAGITDAQKTSQGIGGLLGLRQAMNVPGLPTQDRWFLENQAVTPLEQAGYIQPGRYQDVRQRSANAATNALAEGSLFQSPAPEMDYRTLTGLIDALNKGSTARIALSTPQTAERALQLQGFNRDQVGVSPLTNAVEFTAPLGVHSGTRGQVFDSSGKELIKPMPFEGTQNLTYLGEILRTLTDPIRSRYIPEGVKPLLQRALTYGLQQYPQTKAPSGITIKVRDKVSRLEKTVPIEELYSTTPEEMERFEIIQ